MLFRSVLEDKAEDIKKTFGTASPEYTEDDDKLLKAKNSANTDALELPMRTIHDVVLSRYDEIMENVLNQARLAGFKQQPASYVITGGGANMKGLPELIRSKTGSEVKKAIFPTAVMSKVHNDCDSDPTLSVLVGMLLSGTENCCKEKDFVIEAPKEEPVEKTVRDRNVSSRERKHVGGGVSSFFTGIFGNIKNPDTDSDAEFE